MVYYIRLYLLVLFFIINFVYRHTICIILSGIINASVKKGEEVPLKIVLEENVRKLILRLTAETQQADYDEGS